MSSWQEPEAEPFGFMTRSPVSQQKCKCDNDASRQWTAGSFRICLPQELSGEQVLRLRSFWLIQLCKGISSSLRMASLRIRLRHSRSRDPPPRPLRVNALIVSRGFRAFLPVDGQWRTRVGVQTMREVDRERGRWRKSPSSGGRLQPSRSRPLPLPRGHRDRPRANVRAGSHPAWARENFPIDSTCGLASVSARFYSFSRPMACLFQPSWTTVVLGKSGVWLCRPSCPASVFRMSEHNIIIRVSVYYFARITRCFCVLLAGQWDRKLSKVKLAASPGSWHVLLWKMWQWNFWSVWEPQ